MRVNKERLTERIAVAAKREKADLVIKNGTIVDVFNCELFTGDVAISHGVIVGVGEYEGEEVIDAEGKFICPGLIDGHVHIESSMVRPSEFAKVVLPHGVTSIVTDPHEIGNVSGVKGIEFMLEDSEGIPLDVFFMLPSCVPTTEFETAGAVLEAEQLLPLYAHERVLGLGEVMNYPAVYSCDKTMMNKITDALQNDKLIDGHGAGLMRDEVNVFMTAGIRTDHECNTMEEALERVRRGMYVMIREGTASKDLRQLLTAVNARNSRRFLFVTDDKHIDELIEEGSIDHNIRFAIELGLDPIIAIQMATINAAECFRLSSKGAIAPGYDADFLLLESLDSFIISDVYKAGKPVASKGRCFPFQEPEVEGGVVLQSVKMAKVSKEMLAIQMNEHNRARIIEVIPHQIVTEDVVEEVVVKDNKFIPSVEKDQLKLAVVERHHATGNIGLGIVKGMGITSGAIACSVAHDSHNFVVVGTNDDDMLMAIKHLRMLGGGKAVVHSGRILADIPLPIAGLMSEERYDTVLNQLKKLNDALLEIGFKHAFNPFSTLSFLSLPVIPHLKLTDKGLFDVNIFKHVEVAETL